MRVLSLLFSLLIPGTGFVNAVLAQTIDTPPSTPEGLAAEAYSSTAGEVRWQRSNDDKGVAGYEIIRDGVPSGVLDTLSVVEFDLEPGTSYLYEITAIDTIGQRSGTSTIELTTRPALNSTLAAPQNLSAIVYSSTAAELFWTRSPVPGLYYEIFRDGEAVFFTDGISYYTSELEPGRMYLFEVEAIDNEGVRSSASVVEITTPAGVPAIMLSSPQNLRAEVYSSTAAELFWARAMQPGIRYEISRDGSVLAETDGTSYFDDTLEPGTVYNYAVTAVDGSGQRSVSSGITISSLTVPTTSDPYLEPNPDGSSIVARLGYHTATDLANFFVSAEYLIFYFDIHAEVVSLLQSVPGGDNQTVDCPGGGVVEGDMNFFSFDAMFIDCRIDENVLHGSLQRTFSPTVFGLGSSAVETLEFDEFSRTSNVGTRLQLSGQVERNYNSILFSTSLDNPACAGASSVSRGVDSQLELVSLQIELDSEVVDFKLTTALWAQTVNTTPDDSVPGPICEAVESVVAQDDVLFASNLFLPNLEPGTFYKTVDIARGLGETAEYTGPGLLAGIFPDGSSFEITSTETDGDVQVIIIDGDSVVTFFDEFGFEASEAIPPIF